MREVFEPSRNWRMGPFRLNPQPFLEDLSKYNPTLPLSHALSSEEVREQVHGTLAAQEEFGSLGEIQNQHQTSSDKG